ncbi:GNAT family N-acetyltransferase [Chloroflexi bacterium TSY]|nr:GNAT family N-acetyltransferase [Chloroflexi bacterium TSY]
MAHQPHNLEQPILNITGEKVALGPPSRDLIPLSLKWLNDFEVTHPMGMHFQTRTREAVETGYENYGQGGSDYVDFIIYEWTTMRPIGLTNLLQINYQDRTALYAIRIGEKECWGKGYGTETTKLVLDYGFTGLGLHNIWLSVLASTIVPFAPISEPASKKSVAGRGSIRKSSIRCHLYGLSRNRI